MGDKGKKQEKRKELLIKYNDFGSEWLKKYLRIHMGELSLAGFEDYEEFEKWAKKKIKKEGIGGSKF